mgnify:CR=1 FL=1
MKTTMKLALALTLSLPLAACGENNAAETKEANKGAMGALAEKAGEMKDSAMKMFDGQIGDVSKSIDELKSKSASLTGEKKTEIDGLIKNIMAKKDEVMKMIGDLKGMDGSALEGLKTKINEAIPALKKMVDEAMAKLK